MYKKTYKLLCIRQPFVHIYIYIYIYATVPFGHQWSVPEGAAVHRVPVSQLVRPSRPVA